MSNALKKIGAALLLMAIAMGLSGCGNGSDVKKVNGLKSYETPAFTLLVDPSWKVILPGDFYAEVPQETVVAFAAPEAVDGFFANVSVVKENLKQRLSSVDYGRANITLSGQNLTDYQKIQEGQVEVNGEKALLHIFQARLNPTEKLLRFIQLYATRGNDGYIVTAGMLPDAPKELRDKVGTMATSLIFK